MSRAINTSDYCTCDLKKQKNSTSLMEKDLGYFHFNLDFRQNLCFKKKNVFTKNNFSETRKHILSYDSINPEKS